MNRFYNEFRSNVEVNKVFFYYKIAEQVYEKVHLYSGRDVNAALIYKFEVFIVENKKKILIGKLRREF